MNIKVRLKNPVFLVQLFLSFLTPILAYCGLTFQDMNSWSALVNVILCAFKNPYVLGMVLVSLWNALNDPTTAGLKDSSLAMTYEVPKKEDDDE